MKRFLSIWIIVSFVASSIVAPQRGYAQEQLNLPLPGAMVNLSPAYEPVLIKGLKVHPENPLLFDFILDTGRSRFKVNSPEFKSESEKLIKYFLASLTIKEDDLWVNLSPYEKDRMIPQELGQTELGRDMLAQDYILKQLTASLIYPEKRLGKEFWSRVYSKAQQMFSTANIPVNTFNKVWIVADKAKVLERNNTAYVVGAHLKVMLEEDYLALQKHSATVLRNNIHSIGANITREIIIPELEKEVNQGQNFASLRQMFYSMILATWYRLALKHALLNQVYSNQGKIGGVLSDDPRIKDKIYEQYIKAYKRGVFNYIKEDMDTVSKQTIPRKYFSGGLARNLGILPILILTATAKPEEINTMRTGSLAMVTADMAMGAKPVLLLVDDDEDKMTPLIGPLEARGYIIKKAYDGIEALAILKEDPTIAGVISDINMPHMNGRDLALNIFNLYPQLPVVLRSSAAPFWEDTQLTIGKRKVWLFSKMRDQRLVNHVHELIPTDVKMPEKEKVIKSYADWQDVPAIPLFNYTRPDGKKVTITIGNTQFQKPTLEHYPSRFDMYERRPKLKINPPFTQIASKKSADVDLILRWGSHHIKVSDLKDVKAFQQGDRGSVEQIEVLDQESLFMDHLHGFLTDPRGLAARDVWYQQHPVSEVDIIWDAQNDRTDVVVGRPMRLPATNHQIVASINRIPNAMSAWGLGVDISQMPATSNLAMSSRQITFRTRQEKDRKFETIRKMRRYSNMINGRYGQSRGDMSGIKYRQNNAATNFAQTTLPLGGIDLNAKNMSLDVAKNGKGIEMKFDPAMVAEFQRGNFSGIVANIIRITPIASPLPLLGMDPLQENLLAKA